MTFKSSGLVPATRRVPFVTPTPSIAFGDILVISLVGVLTAFYLLAPRDVHSPFRLFSEDPQPDERKWRGGAIRDPRQRHHVEPTFLIRTAESPAKLGTRSDAM